jgi:Chromo (CHRromatin Organisation MOdifier) domain
MVRVSSDRVTLAPVPRSSLEETHTEDVTESSDLPDTPVPADPSGEGRPEEPEVMPTNGDEPEYVMEKIVGARKLLDGSLRYRVRWYGYSREDDTWEPASHLPKSVLRKYHRRTGLPLPNN